MIINFECFILKSRQQNGNKIPTTPEKCRFGAYLPMQNLLKIFPKISSVEICPVISPR